MFTERVQKTGFFTLTAAKLKDYAQFAKLRLATLVVFSAVITYWFGATVIEWDKMFYLIVGGFLVTAASNGINQILERDLDAKMKRTLDRPLPANRMTVMEGILLSIILGAVGISMLFFGLNAFSGWLGVMALVSYTAIYTPLKRVTPFAVFVGAFPGAIPPMLGYVAVTGEFGLIPGVLFAIQFIWQFPHFWAIAWKLDDDYAKGGFRLLPSRGGKDKGSAFQILVYSLFLIPVSLLPTFFGFMDYFAAMVSLVMGLWFLTKAIQLYKSNDEKDATKLMFASFIYLPIVQLAWVADKLLLGL